MSYFLACTFLLCSHISILAMCIYIYIYIKKTNFIVCDCCKHQKITYFFIQIYFGIVFLRQCMYMCVSIYICICYVYNLHIYSLNVSYIIFEKGKTTFEKFNRVLLVNFQFFKCIVSCSSVSSLTFIQM